MEIFVNTNIINTHTHTHTYANTPTHAHVEKNKDDNIHKNEALKIRRFDKRTEHVKLAKYRIQNLITFFIRHFKLSRN